MSLSLFPAEPEKFIEIAKYTSSGTFVADSDGYYEIELQGASGCGGEAKSSGEGGIPGGGGGGGGACAVSKVKMKKGDTVVYTLGKASQESSDTSSNHTSGWVYAGDSFAAVNSSFDEFGHTIRVTGAANGDDTDGQTVGKGGAGGTAFGGNVFNKNGGNGKNGGTAEFKWDVTAFGGDGGAAGYSGGNAGGKGADNALGNTNRNRGTGKNAFIVIRAGDTNR